MSQEYYDHLNEEINISAINVKQQNYQHTNMTNISDFNIITVSHVGIISTSKKASVNHVEQTTVIGTNTQKSL